MLDYNGFNEKKLVSRVIDETNDTLVLPLGKISYAKDVVIGGEDQGGTWKWTLTLLQRVASLWQRPFMKVCGET